MAGIINIVGNVLETVGNVILTRNQKKVLRESRLNESRPEYINPFADSVNSQSTNNLIVMGGMLFFIIALITAIIVVSGRKG